MAWNMIFDLNDEQKKLRDRIRQLAQQHIAPQAARWDEEEIFPRAAIDALAAEGLLGMAIPRQYGGLELDLLSYAIVLEEIARYDGGTALTLTAHNTLAAGHLKISGTSKQKERYLPALASGEMLGAWALSETTTGSDAASLQTQAERTREGWRLNGSKMFVTLGSVAGLFIVLARTSRQEDKRHAGISAFLVPAEAAGVKRGAKLKKMGCRSSDTTSLLLKNVQLSDEALLGREGKAFADIMAVLDRGRVGMAAMAVGIARACLEEALAYARRRKQFGQPIGKAQAIQWMLADMATEIDAARLLVWRAAARITAGEQGTREAAMAKLHASEVATRAANTALQIHGGYGYLRDFPVERYLRDAKACELGEGTSEMQRLVIARELLGPLS